MTRFSIQNLHSRQRELKPNSVNTNLLSYNNTGRSATVRRRSSLLDTILEDHARFLRTKVSELYFKVTSHPLLGLSNCLNPSKRTNSKFVCLGARGGVVG
jgi:hypothetical protein